MSYQYDIFQGLVTDHGHGKRIRTLENKDVRAEFYEQLTAVEGVSGTITLPTGATLLVDSWQDSYEGVVTTITDGQLPDQDFAREADGTIITVDYLDNGDGTADYTLSGTPSAWPVAILYEYSVAWVDYDITKDLNNLISISTASVLEDRIGFGVVSNNPIAAGTKMYRTVPFDCTISSWHVETDVSGNVTVNVTKGMDSPVAVVGSGTKPNLASQTSNSGSASGWDVTQLLEGEVLIFAVESGATVEKLVVTLDIGK